MRIQVPPDTEGLAAAPIHRMGGGDRAASEATQSVRRGMVGKVRSLHLSRRERAGDHARTTLTIWIRSGSASPFRSPVSSGEALLTPPNRHFPTRPAVDS